MAKLLVKNKDLVVPGEVLVEGMEYLPAKGVYRDGDKLISNTIGLVNIDNRLIKLVPLTGVYIPKRNDVVIGKVADINFSGWMIDFGYSNNGMLSLKEATNEFIERGADLTKFYNFGDIVVAKMINVTKDGSCDLSMKGPGLLRLNGGRVIDVAACKVPRIIGKQGSMIGVIKEKTGCRITVGQNGKVWIQNEDPAKETKAIEAIRLIEREATKDGLTEEVERFLK
jgi:exosome complex component RRP4